MINGLKKVKKDRYAIVDEYKSTITCSTCFQPTTKQAVRRNELVKRIKGAMVCINIKFPKRVLSKSTTTKHDRNGAPNIALTGFTKLVSSNGNSLSFPP